MPNSKDLPAAAKFRRELTQLVIRWVRESDLDIESIVGGLERQKFELLALQLDSVTLHPPDAPPDAPAPRRGQWWGRKLFQRWRVK